MSGATQAVRDDDFVTGVMSRRIVAWLIDFLLIMILVCAVWVVLFLFGLINAGVPLGAFEEGVWGLPIAVLIGKPIGVMVAAGLAVALGLKLPHRVGWRDLLVVGFLMSVGFSFALYVSTALLPPGQVRSEASMGVLMSLVALPAAVLLAVLLRVGRFRRPG